MRGYWDRGDVEIDLVAIDEGGKRIRFGTCRRDPAKLMSSLGRLHSGANSFLTAHSKFRGWKSEFVAIAPSIDADLRTKLTGIGVLAEDLVDLTRGM